MTVLAADELSAGSLGLLVVVLLGVATVLLIRNMNARLRRLPKSFDEPAEGVTPRAEAVTPREDDRDEGASGPTAGA